MPSVHRLTDQLCKAATPNGEKTRKLFDGGGLFLFVTPAGGKIWRLQYRIATKQQTLVIGKYPLITLREARELAQAALRDLEHGIRPASPKRKLGSKHSMTLSAAFEAYWAGRQDISDGYRDNAIRAFEMHVEPKLGARAIESITREDMLAVLNVLNEKGHFVYVRKVRLWCSQTFDWAVEQGKVKINPVRDIRPAKAFGQRKVVNHPALPLREVPDLLLRLELEDQNLLSVLAFRLMLLTWVRTGELRFIQEHELERDDALWRVPEGRMKRGLEHLVPLSRQAREVVAKLRAMRIGGPYLLPNARRLDRAMSENAILYLIGRMGFGGRMTGHGMRSIASTWANENGWNPDAVELQLAHSSGDEVRAAYNRAKYLPLRTQMMQAWADWLDAEVERRRKELRTGRVPLMAVG